MKCCAITLELADGYFCINASSYGPKVKRGRPKHGESLQDELPFLSF
jgi:hypothetical protein